METGRRIPPQKAEDLLEPYVILCFPVSSHSCYFRTRNQRKDERLNEELKENQTENKAVGFERCQNLYF